MYSFCEDLRFTKLFWSKLFLCSSAKLISFNQWEICFLCDVTEELLRTSKILTANKPQELLFELFWEEMHLWPSLKLRNSFKSTSRKKSQRMNSGKQTQSNQQKLLKEPGPDISSGVFAVVCRDIVMVFSCCYCCFCCGGKPSQHSSLKIFSYVTSPDCKTSSALHLNQTSDFIFSMPKNSTSRMTFEDYMQSPWLSSIFVHQLVWRFL